LAQLHGKELVEAVDGIACKEACEELGEISFGIDGVQQQVSMSEARIAHCSPRLSEPAKKAFLRERKRTDGPLDDVGVDLDPAVFDEATEPVPA
jgi:hypothetical protein